MAFLTMEVSTSRIGLMQFDERNVVVRYMWGHFDRCDLVIWSGRLILKPESGLVKPFVCYLSEAEEQFDNGSYSIIL